MLLRLFKGPDVLKAVFCIYVKHVTTFNYLRPGRVALFKGLQGVDVIRGFLLVGLPSS
jgi:hypothetical protein